MLGGAKLVNSPDLIAAGQYTSSIPDRPDPPSGYSSGKSLYQDYYKASPHSLMSGQLIAVGTRPSNKVNHKIISNFREEALCFMSCCFRLIGSW